MWIEFLGGVGSGKSSLATALRERLNTAEFPVSSPQQLLDIRLAQALPGAIRYGRSQKIARRALLTGYQARFSLKHPKLVWQAWNASQNLRNLPGWHRNIIFHLFFEVAGWYEAVPYRVPPKRIVVVDEGLAHRSINLFAWQNRDLDAGEIQAYIENLPKVVLTILVCAPVQDCLERAYNRGLPLRLRGKDPQTVRRFVENSHTVALLAGNALTSRGSPVIEIDNSLGLEQSITTLCSQITETPMFQKYFTKQYQTAFS
jgi:thymidylate kinase